MLTVDI